MRFWIATLLALFAAGSVSAREAAAPESPQERAALEAIFERQTADMTRDLDERIERITSQMTADWLDARFAQTRQASATTREVRPASPAPEPAKPAGSRMPCGLAADGAYECLVAALPMADLRR